MDVVKGETQDRAVAALKARRVKALRRLNHLGEFEEKFSDGSYSDATDKLVRWVHANVPGADEALTWIETEDCVEDAADSQWRADEEAAS